MLCAGGQNLDVRDIPRDGVWISRTAVRKRQRLYRVAVNTSDGKHFDLLVGVWDPDMVLQDLTELHKTIYWMVALSGHLTATLRARFGCWRPAMGALSTTFVNNLNVGNGSGNTPATAAPAPVRTTIPTGAGSTCRPSPPSSGSGTTAASASSQA